MSERDECACLSGSERDGWHEVRCGECLAQERQVWAEMMQRTREPGWLERVLKESKREQ